MPPEMRETREPHAVHGSASGEAPPVRETILSARGLVKHFPLRDGLRTARLTALRGVDLDLHPGECLALVGESGCGKTTLGKCLVGHLRPDAGRVIHDGVDLSTLRGDAWRRHRRRLQLVFQDSAQAFDPRLRVLDSLAEALPRHMTEYVGSESRKSKPQGKEDVRERAAELLRTVDLDAELLDRRPHQLSGGQRQRLGVARALAAEAEVVVLDEPVSALDATVRGQVLELLRAVRREHDVTLVFIGHDLGVVRQIADRVAVLYLGRIVEIGPTAAVLSRPLHPYTRALLDSVPRLTTEPASQTGLGVLSGDVPSAVDPPPGCPFHPRCPRAEERCRVELPMLRSPDETPPAGPVEVACHRPLVAD